MWLIELGFRINFILIRYRFMTTTIFICSASTVHKSFKGRSPKNIHTRDPLSTSEWPPYWSRYLLPSYFHYRDPQIETLPRVPPVFNMALSHREPLLS